MKYRLIMAAAAMMAMPGGLAYAQSPEEFYSGNTVYLQIGSGTGGGYDTVGRLVARHIGKHIPGNPTVIVQNVPGGGSLALANEFANVTPRDGTVFGIMNNGMPTTPLMLPGAVHYDARDFNFLGSTSGEVQVFLINDSVPVHEIDDIFTTEIVVGTSSPGAAPYDISYLYNALLGTQFRIITGYPSATDVKFAMESGEVDANPAVAWGSAKTLWQDEIANGSIRILGQFGFELHPELEAMGVELFPVGDDEADRQVFELMFARQIYGRPFLTPPDVPQDRLDALRAAFEATMEDPEFLAEAQQILVEIEPVSWQDLTELTANLYETPESTLERIRELLAAGAQ